MTTPISPRNTPIRPPLQPPPLVEYLKSAEGKAWTRVDTLWVLQHLRSVERLAQALIRKAQERQP